MKKLETYFVKNGYNHLIVWRDEDYAISKLTHTCSGTFVCYEAYKIKKTKERILFGKVVEASELTPSNEEWGIDGFTVQTLEQAHEKINLLKEKKIKNEKRGNKRTTKVH